jgi:nitrate/nitrite transporter NarK
MAFAANSSYLFTNSWLPPSLAAEFGTTPAISSLLVAVFPAMGVLARPAGGAVSDRPLGRRLPFPRVASLVSLPIVGVARTRADRRPRLSRRRGLRHPAHRRGVYSSVRESVGTAVSDTALSLLTTAGSFGTFSSRPVTGGLIDFGGSVAAFADATVLT